MDNACKTNDKTTQVAAEMENSRTNSLRLEKLVSELEERLLGILVEKEAVEDDEKEPVSLVVPLAQGMRVSNRTTFASLARLQSILDRLEL